MIERLRTVRRDDQAGFTLVELLVTIAIMAIAIVIVLGAIAVFMRTTTVHRTSADLDSATRTYVERLATAPYTNCATVTTYPAAVPAPSGYAVSIQVRYWDGNATPAGFSATCSTDRGAQELTVTLRRTASGQQDSLVLVKRKP